MKRISKYCPALDVSLLKQVQGDLEVIFLVMFLPVTSLQPLVGAHAILHMGVSTGGKDGNTRHSLQQ